MNDTSVKPKDDKTRLYLTIIIVIFVAICSSIGIFHEQIYSKESIDWLSQCIGQDISNLFIISPVLLISAFYDSKGNKISKIIWVGAMMTNIYSYAIYCFSVHFNFLFHVYCLILGLSIFSVLNFFITYINENFKSWYKENVHTKATSILLIVVASMFSLLWLSDSLPAVLSNRVPENIIKNNLLANPVQALDFSFYLPLMFISSFMLIKKKSLGYLIAPMMIVFAILTNINIICLMIVTMYKNLTNNTPIIIVFCIFTLICIYFLCIFLKSISEKSKDTRSL